MTPEDIERLWDKFVSTPIGFIILALALISLAIVFMLVFTRLMAVIKSPRQETTLNTLLGKLIELLGVSENNHQKTNDVISGNTSAVATLAQSVGGLKDEFKTLFSSAVSDMRTSQGTILGQIKTSEKNVTDRVSDLDDSHANKLDVISQQAVNNFQLLNDIVTRAETNRLNIEKNTEQINLLSEKLERKMQEQEDRIKGYIETNGTKRHDENESLLAMLKEFKAVLDNVKSDIEALRGMTQQIEALKTQLISAEVFDKMCKQQSALLEKIESMNTLIQKLTAPSV